MPISVIIYQPLNLQVLHYVFVLVTSPFNFRMNFYFALFRSQNYPISLMFRFLYTFIFLLISGLVGGVE